VPTLKETNIVDIMENVVIYFRKRLPRLEKKITIKENYTISPVVKLNGELFEWVIENLLKNAIDAIESKGGVIEISLRDEDNNFISVDISDTGKGINTRDKTDIFKPGFSTKTRGWGLGLSLAKRIIEDYHGGRIIITETHIGKGSTFRILLKNA
jgi:signal transduction histidine kinase